MTQIMTLPFFLSSGSFTTNIDLGPDQNICDGNTFEIKTGLTTQSTSTVGKKITKQSVKTKKH
jgi:hypothetical protein